MEPHGPHSAISAARGNRGNVGSRLFEAIDLGGTLTQAFGTTPPQATIINCSVDFYVHNGWSMDHQGFPPVDVLLAATPDAISCASRRNSSEV